MAEIPDGRHVNPLAGGLSLSPTVCPDIRDALEVRFHVTPEHFCDNLLTHHGTGFSIQPTLFQSAWFRFNKRSEDVEGLYLVGAGTHPGAGSPGVLCSAKALEYYLPEILSRAGDEQDSVDAPDVTEREMEAASR